MSSTILHRLRTVTLVLLVGVGVAAQAAEPAPGEPSELVARFAAAPTGHPRLFADAATFARIREQLATDPALKAVAATTMAQADYVLTRPPLERVVRGRGILDISRQAIGRVTALSMAWHLTNEQRYAERAERELLAVARFSDWGNVHFLDTAEMAMAVAIGYDWLFSALPEATRRELHEALVEKALLPGATSTQFWVSGTNNWTQVCHVGLLAGALALRDERPDLALTIASRALANLPRIMEVSYAPDGVYPEGPGYWLYGTSYNVLGIEALRSVLGFDGGLVAQPGFLATGDFFEHLQGPSGKPFNYSDGTDDNPGFVAARTWFARERHSSWSVPATMPSPSDKNLDNYRFLPMALIWGLQQGGTTTSLPLDFHGRGTKPLAIFRSAWGDPEAAYLGVCAGSPNTSHGHMDIGSFVYEARGVRWAVDVGPQSYNDLESKGVKLWGFAQDSQRWSVLRLNNLAHNTLNFSQQHQVVTGNAPITEVHLGSASPGCTVDLSTVYAGQAASIQRRFTLRQRRQLVAEDTIHGIVEDGEVTWQMVTKAAVTIAADGRSAQLAQQGRTLTLTLYAPAAGRLSASGLDPQESYDAPNPGCTVISATVPVTAGSDLAIAVTLDPQ